MSTGTPKQVGVLQGFPVFDPAAAATSSANSALNSITPISAPQKRQRLNARGTAILEEFRKQHDDYPTAAEVAELCQKIKAVGNPHWDDKKLKLWFYRKKRRGTDDPTFSAVPESVSATAHHFGETASLKKGKLIFRHYQAWPTARLNGAFTDPLRQHLTSEQIAQLRVLTDPYPSPTEELVSLWAQFLCVEKDLIRAWLRDRQSPDLAGPSRVPLASPTPESDDAMMMIAHAQVPPAQRLPTPADTVSPTPSLGSPVMCYTRPYRFMHTPDNPPDAAPSAPSPTPLSTSQFPSHSMHIQPGVEDTLMQDQQPPPPLIAESAEHTPLVLDPTLRAIIEGAKEAMETEGSRRIPPPTSAEEFNAIWSNFEPIMSRLSEALAEP